MEQQVAATVNSLSRQLVGGLEHLHQEGVYWSVSNEFEKEEVFETLESDGAQGREAEEQFCKPWVRRKKRRFG